MLKLFKGETTYIPLAEIPEKIRAHIPPESTKKFFFGECAIDAISETEYNTIITSDEELYAENGSHPELTKVTSLAVQVEEYKRIAPLKVLFLSNLGISEKEILKKIQIEEKAYQEEAIQKLQSTAGALSSYREKVDLLKDETYIDEEKLHSAGLTLQCYTEIAGTTAGLGCYVAGNGIFQELYLDEYLDDDWSNVYESEDGIVIVDGDTGEEKKIKRNKCGRDFRQYRVFENIVWCLRNLSVKNDMQDELDVEVDGIFMHAGIEFVAKMLNPKAFPERIYIEGKI